VYQNLSLALESSAATWKIVVGHHTIRSLGRHGDTPELVKSVLPILEVSPTPSHPLQIRSFSIHFVEEYFPLEPHLLILVLVFLQSHNVDVYINGHDHCLEHIKREDR
jgi:tartrate-resistant acid phosphatase type 5